jgi:membrane peptidoglycan carboxypeptidase
MGYQVGVTPLQMAAAVSSVANGGELLEPRVVRAVVRDGKRLPVPRKALRRTIGAGTAAELTRIMEAVVERGTATRAQVAGFTVAGKTGTSKKLVNGRYLGHSNYNASFIGFVPSRKPVYTIIVVIDSPRAKSYYGGAVAAPVWQRIAEAALRHRGVPPTLNAPPPILVARGDQPREVHTSGSIGPAHIRTVSGADGRDQGFPDLRGRGARDAIRTLARIGVTARMHGTGVVAEQQPEPGAPFDRRTPCVLKLAREPFDSAQGKLPDPARGKRLDSAQDKHMDAAKGRAAARAPAGTQP